MDITPIHTYVGGSGKLACEILGPNGFIAGGAYNVNAFSEIYAGAGELSALTMADVILDRLVVYAK